jgi:acyl-CoA dehydrogenase
MDFSYSDKVKDLQRRVSAFMDEHIYPNEARFHAEIEDNRRKGNAWQPTRVMEELKQKARAQDLWNLWLPESQHGAGLTNLEYAPLCEIMGRSALAPEAFSARRPTPATWKLVRYGTEEHKRQRLAPLLEGTIRSASP